MEYRKAIFCFVLFLKIQSLLLLFPNIVSFRFHVIFKTFPKSQVTWVNSSENLLLELSELPDFIHLLKLNNVKHVITSVKQQK